MNLKCIRPIITITITIIMVHSHSPLQSSIFSRLSPHRSTTNRHESPLSNQLRFKHIYIHTFHTLTLIPELIDWVFVCKSRLDRSKSLLLTLSPKYFHNVSLSFETECIYNWLVICAPISDLIYLCNILIFF